MTIRGGFMRFGLVLALLITTVVTVGFFPTDAAKAQTTEPAQTTADCPPNSAPATNYGWTVVHRPARNGKQIPIANVKMQTRFCVSNGQIVGLAASHRNSEIIQIWVLNQQQRWWNVSSRSITCEYLSSSRRIRCNGTVSIAARFGGSASIGIGLSGPLLPNLNGSFQTSGTITMAAFTGDRYPQILFQGAGPGRSAQYHATGVFRSGSWVDVNSRSNGPLCPSFAQGC
ncbi:MAG: hypothetical protein MI924_33930 [Chloroflexales bacterium]|nr:hypothetical protein [Chloroflexales bacterium]